MYLAVGAVAWGVKTTDIEGGKGLERTIVFTLYLTLKLFKSIIDENEMKIENKAFSSSILYFFTSPQTHSCPRCLRQQVNSKCTVCTCTYISSLLYYIIDILISGLKLYCRRGGK